MAAKEKEKEDAEDKEAEEESGEEGAEEGAEGGKKGLDAKKIVLFIVLPLLLLAGIGGGLYFSGILDKFLGKGGEAGEHAADDGHGGGGSGGDGHSKAADAGGAYFLQIPNMIVNLSSQDGQPRYLRLSVQLELANDADLKAVEAVMPRVVDQFQTYLRELRVKDLRGSAGIYRLQVELLSRVNAAAYPVEVKDVLFQEILIQ
ncbi:MAG: flagellar basal body-associated FliL family protein [Proteobacteria bacterium]|nr:flagellar basal body-associated FliL family protein [Pseudomonadota bacterium]